jgi:hypothetical protein
METASDRGGRFILPAPKDWVGEQVKAGFEISDGHTNEVLGELLGVNDRGVIFDLNVDEGRRPVFYPWSKVSWMYPVEEWIHPLEER